MPLRLLKALWLYQARQALKLTQLQQQPDVPTEIRPGQTMQGHAGSADLINNNRSRGQVKSGISRGSVTLTLEDLPQPEADHEDGTLFCWGVLIIGYD